MVFGVKTKEAEELHYVHRVVVAQKVGGDLQPLLAAEPILPKESEEKGDTTAGHEGELTAAKRLVDKVLGLYGPRFVDVLTTDALYMNHPFVSYLHDRNKHLIARVKDERTTLYQEILALAKLTTPICGEDRNGQLRYEIYDVPYLHQSMGWQIPLRGFLIIERTRHVKQRQITWHENRFLCATTLPRWQADANVVRQIVHAKWGIENNGFLDLKQNWYLTHNYHHHPIATFAVLLIQFLVYNLFYAYVFLQMKTYRFYDLTIQEVICEFCISFWQQRQWLPKHWFG